MDFDEAVASVPLAAFEAAQERHKKALLALMAGWAVSVAALCATLAVLAA